MSRYHLIEVGCLECSFDGDSDPVIIMAMNDSQEMIPMMQETKLSHQADRFIFDSEHGTIISLSREDFR